MAKEKEEQVTNCPACKKHLLKAKKYYRNGQYFCNKNCWVKMNKEAKAGSTEETES
ncbi:MAG: hypothetical protein P9M12_06175 [Candidatus Aceula lacicola]|nr:hypothetical protein [Candidatus Aceula lacicola]